MEKLNCLTSAISQILVFLCNSSLYLSVSGQLRNLEPVREQFDFLSNLFSRALKYQSEEQYALLAQQDYEQVLGAIPNHVDSLHYLGLAKYTLGKSSDAIELLRKAALQSEKTVSSTDSAEIYYNLGIVM